MSNALDRTDSWRVDALGQARDGRRIPRARALWQAIVGEPPDDELLELDERADGLGRLTLVFIGALAALAVIAPLRDGLPILGQLLVLAGSAAVLEVGSQVVERRFGRVLWLLVTKVSIFAMLAGAALWFCVSVDHPVVYMRHTIVFLIYLLLITTSGLRDEPRLPLASGIASMVSYGFVATWARDVAAVSPDVKAQVLRHGFDGTSLAGHMTMLFCMTLMAIASARRGQAIRRLSVRDGLTGLVNRRTFDVHLEREGERARRHGRPLSVAMVDVDHFKSLNDAHGHALGDEVLRWIGVRLREAFRATDVVARYGGEEFAIVFVDAADDGIVERLEALRARIADAELRTGEAGERVRVSVSIGVARWPHDAPDVHGVLAEADRRLYAAKEAGRNRVVATGAGDPRGSTRESPPR